MNALKRLPAITQRAAVDLQIAKDRGRHAPLDLVERAIDAKLQNSDIDEIWCVFDVEQPQKHPHLPEAMRAASQSGIELAISNPCFELWLILHFQDCDGWLSTAEAERKRKLLDGAKGKEVDPQKYMDKHSVAESRAKTLDQRHTNNGTAFPHNNPASGMHLLLAAVQRAADE